MKKFFAIIISFIISFQIIFSIAVFADSNNDKIETALVEIYAQTLGDAKFPQIQDYDGDGNDEVFVVTGKWEDALIDGKLWFIDDNGNISQVMTGLYGYSTPFIVTVDDRKFFVWEKSAGGSGSSSIIWGCVNNKPYNLAISGKYEYFRNENGKYLAETSNFDKGYHDWDTHEFLFDTQSLEFVTKEDYPDAVLFEGHYYKIYNNAEEWDEAKEYCENLNGHLATISSQAENDFLYSLMKKEGYTNAYFGLTDSEYEGIWKWINDEPLSYSNWHTGEPNSENSKEDYAMFYYKFTDGTWNDGDFGGSTVNGNKNYICEWDGERIQNPQSISVKINGKKIDFDDEPLMINDRVMVPMRKIFDELGATVEWEDSTQTATAIRGVTFVKIAIDSNKLSITGIRNEDISLDSPAKLIDNRTYVPVRAVSEALDTIVSWNDDEQTVYISTFDGNKDVNAVVVNAESELTINDAALFRDVMLKNKVGNVYEENISVVTEPSETVFEVLIGKLVSLADDDDISYFFYTGHGGYGGTNDSEAVIVPDYSSEHSATYEYTMSELIDCLSEIRGTVVVILDSCFSGAINDLNYDRNKFKILTACAANEYSFTENILSGIATIMFDDSVVNGKFSSVMLNGLGAYEGGGIFNKYNDKVKADENKDNKVTLAELYKYIDKNIDKTTKSDDGKIYTQTPTVSDSDDQTVIYAY